MIDIEHVLEFNVIKNKLKEYAFTSKAKEVIEELQPYMVETDVRARLHETTETRFLIEKEGNPPLTDVHEVDQMIDIASKGGCLSATQLEEVAVMLTAVKRMKEYLNRCKKYDLSLPYYDENLDSMEQVRNELNNKIRNGKVDDYATKLLNSLRSDIERMEQKMREKADMIMRANKECMSDNFSTIRNGHICIPVKKDYKFKINGSVIDKSSTGNTLFIEPTQVAKIYQEIELLRIDEENEERRILYELSDMLADTKEIVDGNSRTIEKLDFMFAKGKLSFEYDGVEPSINTERKINIVNGRHPLMDKKINVPLNFKIGGDVNGVIITGPNTGGKTVAIKTVALNCMMAQCGLHVACEQADFCMNNAYLCDIGDGQNISENLSTFSAHITNVLDILKKANRDSLIVLDELGSGTDPTEGMGIAIAVLQELKRSGALYLVTTHYPEVKNYANKAEGVINARMTFDKESLKPMYQLVIGEAGESCAFYIAGKLGMPTRLLNEASRAAYGTELSDDLKALNDIEDIKHESTKRIHKKKVSHKQQTAAKQYNIGDSVMILPDKKIGIVCKKADDKGVLQVQLQNKKIWINHKRIKLIIPAAELYPEDYDFSIIFETAEQRKLKHDMDRKYVEGISVESE